MALDSCFAYLDKPFSEWLGAKIAVLPVAYDKTSTWIKGADKGPFAIIEASRALELYDIETGYEVYTEGICTLPVMDTSSSPEEMIREVEKSVKRVISSGKFAVVLGGEHSVSVGAVKAYAAGFKDLSVLQLDAHADLRDEYEGSPYNHACTAARIKEICPIVQVGIRSMCIEEKKNVDSSRMFFAEDIRSKKGWAKKAINRLTDNVYVTIDLDVLDPSLIPSTGTPEPGGLGWYELTAFLKQVREARNVVGFDVVELCPNDKNKSPDYAAAKLVYKFLSYIFSGRTRGV
jgi:agmatinase